MRMIFAAAVATAALTAVPGSAATYSARDTQYLITFSGGLSTASTHYTNTITLPAGGASTTTTLNLRTGWQNLVLGATGDVTEALPIPAVGSATTSGTITNGGGGGTFFFNYDTLNGPDFATSWTRYDSMAGLHAAHFNGGGTNFLDVGSPFSVDILIAGNWSAQGIAPGHSFLAAINPEFTITSDFVYDPGTNLTRFSASNAAYSGINPNIDFYLFGGAVPEPASWAMLIAGFGLIGAAQRVARRRRRRAALA